ncbi:hypothetical protein ACWDTI_25275 [Gordonia sp. NPDC003424]
MTFSTLIGAPPSGRGRPLLIEDTDYSAAVIRQGAPIPWTDLAALAGHYGQVQSLLGSDAAWVDVQRWQQAHLDAQPAVIGDMGARSRTGYPLRTLLGHQGLLDTFRKTLTTIADATRRGIVLHIPSPAAWVAWAHEVAGNQLDDVDFDAADSASMYVAEWLGQLGPLPIEIVVLDTRPAPPECAEVLGDYTSVLNVVEHLGWSVAMRGDDRIDTTEDVHAVVVDSEFWTEDIETEDIETDLGAVAFTTIPPASSPEAVLDKLRRLT